MDYQGCFPIVMPENYIAMFSTPTPEEAEKQLAAAYPVIEQAAQSIKKGECFPELPRTMKDKLNSGIVNDLFYPMFVHAKKFTATEACVSCGQCVQECPLKNIKLEAGHPVWGSDCTHCMACISRCPMEAIEYGKHTQGLPRYTLSLIHILLNPLLFIPYMLGVIANTCIAYGSVAIGLCARFTGVNPSWTMPGILQGILTCSVPWQGAVLQIVILAVDMLIWYPFVKMIDKQAVEEENNAVSEAA